MWYHSIAKPVLFGLDPETAHALTFRIGRVMARSDRIRGWMAARYARPDPVLASSYHGRVYPSPIGSAAGFDKNAALVDILPCLGFGHLEVGSVTAMPSAGNPRPRLFRLPADCALINRMGLNNEGAELVARRLAGTVAQVPLGVNVAKTHDPSILGDRAVRDYAFSVDRVEPVADHIVLNVSCPNTEEGKTFEDPVAFSELLSEVRSSKPLYVKFSPDLSVPDLERLVRIANDAGIKGYVASNTSLDRSGLATSAEELASIGRGGLSGRPIRQASMRLLRILAANVTSDTVLVSVGGIRTIDEVVESFKAGANLIQVYTGLVYEGPMLVHRLNLGLTDRLRQEGATLTDWIRASR